MLGNIANANYLGTALGNLAVGSSAAQLEDLVDRWFLRTDHPITSYAYSPAAGQLFVNGVSYTDVKQGILSDCAFMASLAETALLHPSAISSTFIVNGDGTYTLRFYSGGVAEYVYALEEPFKGRIRPALLTSESVAMQELSRRG